MKPFTIWGTLCVLALGHPAIAQSKIEGRLIAVTPSRIASVRTQQTPWQEYARDRRWEEWRRARRVYLREVQIEGDNIRLPGERTINDPRPEFSAPLPDRGLGQDYLSEADAVYLAYLRARDFYRYLTDKVEWRRDHIAYLRSDGVAPSAIPPLPQLPSYDRYLLERDFDRYRTDKAAWQRAYRDNFTKLTRASIEAADAEVRARYERERIALLRSIRGK